MTRVSEKIKQLMANHRRRNALAIAFVVMAVIVGLGTSSLLQQKATTLTTRVASKDEQPTREYAASVGGSVFSGGAVYSGETGSSSDDAPTPEVGSSGGAVYTGETGGYDDAEVTIEDGEYIDEGDWPEEEVPVDERETAEPNEAAGDAAEDAKTKADSTVDTAMKVAEDDATVTVDAPFTANVPEDAKLKVDEVDPESKAYEAYKQQALKALDSDGRVVLARFFRISIEHDGEKVQPEDSVKVSIDLPDAPASITEANASVVHFADVNGVQEAAENAASDKADADAKTEDAKKGKSSKTKDSSKAKDAAAAAEVAAEAVVAADKAEAKAVAKQSPEVIEARESDGTTTFEAQSFSVYGVVYTVDFKYEEAEYSLPGGGSMLLSELFEALGIEAEVGDVEDVTFSNPELLSVERAGKGMAVERLTAEAIESFSSPRAKADDGLGSPLETEELAEDEEFEDFPALTETIEVAEGDWVLTSLKSFETPETLTVRTPTTIYAIDVTDPPMPPNPWGPGFGFFGGTATWNLADLIKDPNKAQLSVTYDETKQYDLGDEVDLSFIYQIEKASWTSLPNNYNPWMGYPTFTYDISNLLKSGNFKDLKATKSYLTFGGKKRGTIEVTPDGKITIQITDTNWFNTRDEIGGSFNVKLKIGNEDVGTQGRVDFDFLGNVPVNPIPLKVHIDAGPKKISNEVKNTDGSRTLTYTASVTTDAVDSLVFEDELGGQQTLGTVTVTDKNNQVVNGTQGTRSDGKPGFTYTFPTGSDSKVQKGTYTVTYTTTVSADVYNNLQGGGTDWTTTNKCNWKYNGDKNLDGGNTTYEITKEPPAKPTVTKTSTPSGSTVEPGGTINYVLTITGTKLAEMNITDTMTDLQVIQGTPEVSVKVGTSGGSGGTENASAAAALKSAIYKYVADSTYNTFGTQVLSGVIPKEAPFTSDDEVTITITYTTKVIDQETATANGIYGEQKVNNTLSENWSWEQHTTTNKVKYTDETVTKVAKTADSSALQDTGTYSGSSLSGSGNGVPDTGGAITYTIVVGDGTTVLDGVKVKDYASGDQRILQDSYTISGSNVSISPDSLHSYIPASPQQWEQTALDFTFPAGTGTGPVTITYKAEPYPASSTDEKSALATAGILGERTLTNKVSTGTDEASTGVKYEYPDIDPFNVQKTATADNGGNDKLEPGETAAYEIFFGANNVNIKSGETITITDEMTDIQKLTGDVKVEIGDATVVDGKVTGFIADTNLSGKTFTTQGGKVVTIGADGSFNMPAASNGWADDGVTWGSFDDGSYNENMVRVFNFKFPTFKDGASDFDITGKTVRVTYTTTIISADEAATSRIMGKKTATNTALSGTGKSSASVEPEFPANLNHNPAISKEFSGWDDDGYTTWWTIGITADEESSFPLKKLTLTEDWANGGINYSTDWPVQNFNKNVLADIDLLGAEIVTDSGITLQPGRDYTIDKEKGSFFFEELDEPVTIRIAIHNPDATINTFYQRNKVNLTWQKDTYNTGQLSAEATGRRVKQEVDLTKVGKYDPDTRVITWTVIFNPYYKDVVPEMSPIQFVDTLAPGLELDGDVTVAIAGNDWQNITIKNDEVDQTPLEDDAAGRPQGTKVTIANLDPQNRWGTPVKRDMYYKVVSGGAWDECTQTEYDVFKNDTEHYTTTTDSKGNETITNKSSGEVDAKMSHDVGLGLSKNSYTITYKTKVKDEKWNEITSSLTGKEVFENKINIGNGGDQNFSASNKVTVEGKDYLIKHDVTREDADGYVIDEEDMHDGAISYEVEINPNRLMINNGRAVTLTDRIDTLMDLDTDTVKVYAVTGEGAGATRTELSNAQLAAQGITISYNDDTRVLSVSGLADQTSYVVAYEAVSRAFGTNTFTNTATLVGGGSHSDSVSDQHAVTNDDSSFWGNRHAKVDLKKIDENDITNRLNDAKFSLYRVNLATDTSSWTRADWMDLLDRVNSGDEAVLAQVAEQFKITGETPIVHNLTAGSKDPKLMFDDGFVSLEYDEYTDVNNPASFVESTLGHNTFLKEHTVYYWIEDTPPDGFHATDGDRHYFVVYLDGELDDDYTHEDDRKKAAWALDDAVTIANRDRDVTIASMASDSVWNVNNTRNGYTSITATKRWEGDYNNVYETRPKNGILYDLYRVDPTTGKETLMEDLSPVPINDDGRGYWSSYTWYRLDSSYKYTVKERAVPGYITTYSDNGKGVEGGTITVTNTYVPKSTDIYVQKKWDPEGGAKSSQVKVQLYKIVHEVNEDGTTTASDPEPMGDDFTYMLTEANNWSYGWKGLDTSDPNGNTISYTVMEDLDAVNADANVTKAKVKYGAVYSDGGEGTVDAPKDNPLVITNLANAPGSLKITKHVTVNGEPTNDTAADGIYRFRITDEDGNPATHMHDHDENCTGDAHNQYLVGDVTVQVQNGVATSTMVDNLEEGTYYVYEYTPEAPMTLVSDQRVEVKVVAGVTEEDKAPEASFTNNVDKNRVEVTKKWRNANNGIASWPEGIEVQVQVMKKTVTGEAPNQTVSVEPVAGVDSVWLTNNRQSYVWDLPDSLPALQSNESYVVVETGIRQGEQNGTVTPDSSDPSKTTSEINVGGTTRSYVAEGEDANADKEDTKGVDYTITNKQVISVPFQKQWGTDGCGEWPNDATSIKIQLLKDGQPYLKDGDDGIRILKKESNGYKAYKSDGTTPAGDVNDVPTIAPTVGGHRYNYTFTGLESGNYTVKEVEVGGQNVGATNLAGGYMVQQIDSTTVRNVSAQTTVTIQKKWLDVDGNELKTTGDNPTVLWPTLDGTPLTISGTITRERRPKGSTLEIEWAPDTAWNELTESDHTFTASSAGIITKTFAKYGVDGDKLYEYRYTATETSVSSSLTDAFEAASSRDGDVLMVTNTPKPTEISFQKKWQNADGTDLAWPQENGSPVRVPIKLVQHKSTYSGSAWSDANDDRDYKTYNVTNNKVITVTDLPEYAYEVDGQNATLVKYSYTVVEPTQIGGFTISRSGDTGSENDPYVITNKTEATSLKVEKQWKDAEKHDTSWPTEAGSPTSINGTITRQRRPYGSSDSDAWENDGTFTPLAFEIHKDKDGTRDGTASTAETTYSNAAGANATFTQTNLPQNGYVDGAHYEFRYVATEGQIEHYTRESSVAEAQGGNPRTYTFTNTPRDDEMSVTVHKTWQTTTGRPVTDLTGKDATFTLHQVRYAALTVNIIDTTSDSVTLTINEDGVNKPVTLTQADGPGYTYDSTTGWTYTYAPLLKGKNYTVAVSSSSGTYTGEVVGESSTSFTAGDRDYTANFNLVPAVTPTLTVRVTSIDGVSPVGKPGEMAINIYDASNNQYVGTIGLKDDTWHWVRTNKQATFTFDVANGKQYYAEVGSFAGGIGSATVVTGSKTNPITVTNDMGVIEITATSGTPKLTVTADGLGADDDGSIVVTVTPDYTGFGANPPSPQDTATQYTLDKTNNWTISHTMDGRSGTAYSVTAVTPDGTHITNAVLDTTGTTQTHGTESATIKVTPTIAPKSLVIKLPNPPSSYQNGGWIAVNLFENDAYKSTYMLTNENNWTATVSELSSTSNYTVDVGSFEANTYSSVTAPTDTISGRTGGEFDLSSIQPGPPMLTILASDRNPSDPGWLDVTVTKVTDLNNNPSAPTSETVRLNAANSWAYNYPMDGDSNTSYTVTYESGNCDGTYVTGVTVGTLNSTNGAKADEVEVATNYNSGGTTKTITVHINWSGISNPDQYHLVGFGNFDCANVNGSQYSNSWENNSYEPFTNSSDTYILSKDIGSHDYFIFTLSNTGSSDNVHISADKTLLYANGGSPVSSSDNIAEGTQIVIPKDTQHIYISFGENAPGAGRIPNYGAQIAREFGAALSGLSSGLSFLQPKVALADAAALDSQYCIFNAAYDPSGTQNLVNGVFSNGTDSYTWNQLPRFDISENENPIYYYVTETCDVEGVTTTFGDGAGYSQDNPLDATGELDFTNTVPETDAEISVQKVFKDANGNTLTEIPADITASNTTFTLKRLKTVQRNNATGDVNVHVIRDQTDGSNGFGLDSNGNTVWAVSSQSQPVYAVSSTAPFGSRVTVSFTSMYDNGEIIPRNNSTHIFVSIGASNEHNQYNWFGSNKYEITGFERNVSGDTVNISFDVPPSSAMWAKENQDGTGNDICEILIANNDPHTFTATNPTITSNGGGSSSGSTTAIDDFSKEIALSGLTYDSDSQCWTGTFTDGSPYPLKDGTTTYTYYVEESGVPAGYATSYKVGDTDVTVPTSASPDGTGWLNGSGTVTVTNKQTTATVKVRKKFVDAAGNACTPAEVTPGSATFKLQRFVYDAEGGSSSSATPDSDYNNDSSKYQSQTLTWTSSTADEYLEATFNPVSLTSDDGTKSYIYYVVESDVTRGYSYSYSVDGDDVVITNPDGWLEGNGTVTVTNKDTTRTSVEVEKKWEDAATGAATTTTHANDAVEFTLYRTTTNTGTDPTMGDADGNGLIFPTSGAEVVPTDSSIVTDNPVTVRKDAGDEWKYAWKNLPTTDNNGHDYTYFVKETGTKRSGQPVTTGMHAVYDCEYADGSGSAHAASGVAKAIITNRETSVSVTKKWQDAVTGMDTTSQHTGDTATFTLYKLEVDAGSTPDSFTVDATTGRALPQGVVKVSGNDTLGNAILNDVAVSADTNWTHIWNNLPLQNAEDSTDLKDIYYYVVESATRVDDKSLDGDTASSYVYGTDGDGFNTDGDPTSGVKNAIVTNRETNVKAAKTWYDDQRQLDVSLAHRGQTVTLELWRALKKRGANSGVVSIAEDEVTNLAFPTSSGNGLFADFERVDSQTVRYDVIEFNWSHEWEHLPTVVVKDGETYDVSYYVRESANTEGAVSAWYDATYVNPEVGENSGVSSVAITNHETSVKASKTWSGGGHTDATVTLELWKAVKAPASISGTFDVVQDATSGLAFPVAAEPGDYLASARIDRVTLKYDAAFNDGAGAWHTEWNHLPTHEDFLGVTYELVYYVREAEATENGQTYPASARYVEEYNTTGDKDSGVKSVAIENYETSVKAVKVWANQSGNSAEAYHQANDHVTFELWKARKNPNGEYGVNVAANSLMRFPRKVTGNGKFDAPELVDTKNVAYNETANEHWAQEWTRLPLYETVDGKTYELAYFVREKSVFTDGAEYMPSPTYDYALTGGGDVSNDGVNGGIVTVTNHETSVEVEKIWDGFPQDTDFSSYTATAQLYKARKAIDGLSGAYKVATDSTSHLQMPEPKGTSTGVIESYEPFPNAIGVAELKFDSDPTKSFKHKWINLPMYETDPDTGLTYKLEYFVKETAASAPGITTTYAYEYHDNNQSKGFSKVTITNTDTNKWSVKADKHWTGGNAGHEGVVMELTRYTKSGDVETKDEGFLKTITLDDGNSWEYTWTGLDSSITISGNTYTTADGTLIYKVAEKFTDENNVQRKDFAVEYEDPNDHSKGTKWPDYQTGTNTGNRITYWVVTNKPVYTGKLKIKKTFDGIELSTFAGVPATSISQEHRAALEAAEKELQYDITTVDSFMINNDTELVRRTWHLVHPKNNPSQLVWVDEPVLGQDLMVPKTEVAANETYDAYVTRYEAWESAFKNDYDYVTYADFANGEFQIVDSPTHTGTLSDDLVMDKIYDVTELNAKALIANHTLVADKSDTSGSGHAPKDAEDVIKLTNTYAPVKGTLRVTKDVTLNGEKYDDVAAGKTFKIGIEKWSGTEWLPLYHDVSTTQTMRLENGETTVITTTEEKPWIQTVTMGKGSTATVVFDGLDVPGRYRAYEVADDAWGDGTPISKQDENAENGLPIAGYKWEVTETGTYYTYATSTDNGITTETRTMVTSEGTYQKVKVINSAGKVTSEDKEWTKVADFEDSNKVIVTNSETDGTEGVQIAAGTEEEKAPRNAELTITNNKTETGSITVNKKVSYNGSPDTTMNGKSFKFGLYRDAMKDELADNSITKIRLANGTQVVPVMEKDDEVVLDVKAEGATVLVRDLTFGNEATASDELFTSLPYTRTYDYTYTPAGGDETTEHNTDSVTYHVLEMENKGTNETPDWQPITGKTAAFDFGADSKTYTVIGGDEAVLLNHEDNEGSVTYSNALKEQGSIKVEKYVGDEIDFAKPDETKDTSATGKFRVGLFKYVGSSVTPDYDSADNYVLQQGRISEIDVAEGSGTVTFNNLDFERDGTTYFVFEIDENNQPVMNLGEMGGYKVTYGASTGNVASGQEYGFTLTQDNHNYDGQTQAVSTGNQGTFSSAVIANAPTKSEFRVVKVDRLSWVEDSSTDKHNATKLTGAEFTLRRIDENADLLNDGMPANKLDGTGNPYPTRTVTVDQNGIAEFTDVEAGWYEVKETKTPTGYLNVGESAFYMKIAGGKAIMLHKGTEAPKNWSNASASDLYNATTNADCNVMAFEPATEASGASPATMATVTIGNIAGAELPSTGGIGTHIIYALGALLLTCSAFVLLQRRRFAGV